MTAHTTWVLVDLDRRCGQCGTVIPARTWFVELRLPRVTRVLVRCETCAAEAGAVTPDWKARAAGER
jgi:RNase P subunit RPR2